MRKKSREAGFFNNSAEGASINYVTFLGDFVGLEEVWHTVTYGHFLWQHLWMLPAFVLVVVPMKRKEKFGQWMSGTFCYFQFLVGIFRNHQNHRYQNYSIFSLLLLIFKKSCYHHLIFGSVTRLSFGMVIKPFSLTEFSKVISIILPVNMK